MHMYAHKPSPQVDADLGAVAGPAPRRSAATLAAGVAAVFAHVTGEYFLDADAVERAIPSASKSARAAIVLQPKGPDLPAIQNPNPMAVSMAVVAGSSGSFHPCGEAGVEDKPISGLPSPYSCCLDALLFLSDPRGGARLSPIATACSMPQRRSLLQKAHCR